MELAQVQMDYQRKGDSNSQILLHFQDEETSEGVANPSFQPDSEGAPPTYQDTHSNATSDYTLPPTLTANAMPPETTTQTTTDNLSKSDATDTSSPPDGDAKEQHHHKQQQQEQPAILETDQPIQHPLQTGIPDLHTTTTS